MRSIALILISLSLCIVVTEGGLRALGFGQEFLGVTIVADQRYGHRVGSLGAVDNLGFRNPELPAHVDLVAIGDSQTYGVSASASGSWPAQLGAISKRSIYNLGIGGYGAVQYDFLWDDYIERLNPSIVVIGLYLGNDIRDAYTYSALFPSSDPLRPNNPPPLPVVADTAQDRRFDELREFLHRHSILYNMTKLALPRLVDIAALQLSQSDESNHEAKLGTSPQFEAEKRLELLSLDEPRNAIGLQITLGYLERLATKCRATSRRCLILVIPTKESVMRAHIQAKSTPHPSLEALWSAEEHIRSILIAAANKLGLRSIDALPFMASAAASKHLYPALDGHPNRLGYGVIAAAVAEAIQK